MTVQEIIHEIEQLSPTEKEMLQAYFELQAWQIQQINQAVAAADRGDFASDETVAQTFRRLRS